MGYLLSLSDLKKLITVSIVFTVLICLFSNVAYAVRLEVSGESQGSTINEEPDLGNSGTVSPNFELETPGDLKDEGFFPGSVKNYTDRGFTDVQNNLISFPLGDLRVTRFTSNSDLDMGMQQFLENRGIIPIDNSLRYDITFPSNPLRLIFFIAFKDLSYLNQSDTINTLGYLTSETSRGAYRFPLKLKLTPVSEPTTITGLLTIGAFSASVSLLKHNKRLKKLI